jgi:hypothetical protein
MQDQQLAAVMMWIPAGWIYVAVGEWVFLHWLREAERRAGVAVLKTLPTVKLILMFVPAAFLTELGGTNAAAQLANGNPARGANLFRNYGSRPCRQVPG